MRDALVEFDRLNKDRKFILNTINYTYSKFHT